MRTELSTFEMVKYKKNNMRVLDVIIETRTALAANKVRTALTMLGIVIGISSVIAMLAIGNGAQAQISSRIQSLGTNIVTVMSGANVRSPISQGRGSVATLTDKDVAAIKAESEYASAVSPSVSSRAQIVMGASNTNTTVLGVLNAQQTVAAIEIEEGRFLTDADNASIAKVVFLGPTTRDDLFGVGGDSLGKKIKIKGIQFTVIGTAVAKGGSGFGNIDDRVYIPLTTAKQYIAGTSNVSTITISADKAENMTALQDELKQILMKSHNIKTEEAIDFSLFNQADLASAANSVTQVFTLLLSSVAAISLLVGGIGIMNMMLTSVRERTREIGLRKAVGAKKNDIALQFLVESIALTVIGGIIGIVLGFLVSLGVSATGLLTTVVSLSSVLLSFGVSFVIGIVFGYYPARKAAGLNPIEALRYE